MKKRDRELILTSIKYVICVFPVAAVALQSDLYVEAIEKSTNPEGQYSVILYIFLKKISPPVEAAVFYSREGTCSAMRAMVTRLPSPYGVLASAIGAMVS